MVLFHSPFQKFGVKIKRVLYKGQGILGNLINRGLSFGFRSKTPYDFFKTGIPIEIERNGHKLLIVHKEKKSKLDNLKPLDCIVGNPDDLIDLKVTQWGETNNL